MSGWASGNQNIVPSRVEFASYRTVSVPIVICNFERVLRARLGWLSSTIKALNFNETSSWWNDCKMEWLCEARHTLLGFFSLLKKLNLHWFSWKWDRLTTRQIHGWLDFYRSSAGSRTSSHCSKMIDWRLSASRLGIGIGRWKMRKKGKKSVQNSLPPWRYKG